MLSTQLPLIVYSVLLVTDPDSIIGFGIVLLQPDHLAASLDIPIQNLHPLCGNIRHIGIYLRFYRITISIIPGFRIVYGGDPEL